MGAGQVPAPDRSTNAMSNLKLLLYFAVAIYLFEVTPDMAVARAVASKLRAIYAPVIAITR